MLSLQEAIVRACNLAGDYYSENLSQLALLEASGNRGHSQAINAVEIKGYVAQHPELVGRWIRYSADKRVDQGWYFTADSAAGPFVVGHFPGDPSKPDETFSDGVEACARFIKNELDDIAS